MKHYIEKANILLEALPYIKKFNEKIFVVKFGGHVMIDGELRKAFIKDVVMFKFIGINPIVVHGGGPQIDEYLQKLGKTPKFVNGLRVTDEETMEIVEMVLVGKINKKIVVDINQMGGKAIGLCGKDANLIIAKQKEPEKGSDINYGSVGEVTTINSKMLKNLCYGKFIPVIAPVGVDENGKSYNLNADTVAGAIASSLRAEKLILLTDVEGVKDRDGSLITSMDEDEITAKISNQVVTGGMIPKIKCCIAALKTGVKKTHIIDGRIMHSILLEIFTQKGVGTEIHLSKDPKEMKEVSGTLFDR
ncbi:MAG TPA: acetylglutamate kinase [bacterium]